MLAVDHGPKQSTLIQDLLSQAFKKSNEIKLYLSCSSVASKNPSDEAQKMIKSTETDSARKNVTCKLVIEFIQLMGSA